MRSIPMRSVSSITEQDTRYNLNSPLLFGAVSSLDPESRVDILDLSAATPELLEYFSEYHCRLNLPGCQDSLLGLGAEEELADADLSRLLSRLIPAPVSLQKPLDLILMWDLPNYLDKRVLAGLVHYLEPWTGGNSLMHSYIHTRQNMPAQPACYRLKPDHQLLVEVTSSRSITSPMYYQELLHKLLSPFRVERGMLLANGMQEYILRKKS